MRVAATKQLPAMTAAAERTIMAMSLITNQTEPRFLRGTTASSHAELYVISNEQNRVRCVFSAFKRSSKFLDNQRVYVASINLNKRPEKKCVLN